MRTRRHRLHSSSCFYRYPMSISLNCISTLKRFKIVSCMSVWLVKLKFLFTFILWYLMFNRSIFWCFSLEGLFQKIETKNGPWGLNSKNFFLDPKISLKNKNYYVVGDAGFARPRNTLKIISNFFLINQWMNQWINRVFLGRLTRRQKSKSY